MEEMGCGRASLVDRLCARRLLHGLREGRSEAETGRGLRAEQLLLHGLHGLCGLCARRLLHGLREGRSEAESLRAERRLLQVRRWQPSLCGGATPPLQVL
jgi:hypothetical protein